MTGHVVGASWIGLLTRQSIVEQLAHTAAINGLTSEDLQESGLPTWNLLASRALGLENDRDIQTAVVDQLRELGQ